MKSLKNKIGQKMASYGEASIYEGFPYFNYVVSEPKLTEKEKITVEYLKNLLRGGSSVEEVKKKLPWLGA